MGRYILRRIGQGLIVIIGVVTVVFVVTRMVGDPAKVMLPLTSTAAQRKAFDHQLGLDKPLVVQYAEFWKGILHGNFGESYVRKQPARLHVQCLRDTVYLKGDLGHCCSCALRQALRMARPVSCAIRLRR